MLDVNSPASGCTNAKAIEAQATTGRALLLAVASILNIWPSIVARPL